MTSCVPFERVRGIMIVQIEESVAVADVVAEALEYTVARLLS